MWARKADIPTAVSAPSASAVGGKIYIIGGRPPNGAMVHEYDPATDSWERKMDMPTPRVCHSVSAVDGKIYAFGGGSTGSGPFLPTVEVYDPATNTWASKADMPTARYGVSTCLINNKIFAIGGNVIENDEEFSVSIVECYDPAKDRWSRKADVPVARFVLASAAFDSLLYTFGGFMWPSQEFSPAVEVYDVDNDSWIRKTDMPVARVTWPTGHVVNDEIYAVGGEPDNMPVVAYNPTTDTWRDITDLPVPSMGVTTARVGDTIYAFAGATTFYKVSSTVYAYSL